MRMDEVEVMVRTVHFDVVERRMWEVVQRIATELRMKTKQMVFRRSSQRVDAC